MASYCPYCGNPFPDEARFCMKCGREMLPEASAPPAMPPAPPAPAPPAFAAGQPAQPSPVGAFLGRVFRGDWPASTKAAAWPTGLLLALAVALAIPSYGQGDEVVVGWSDRLRIALAMLLQGFGGGFEVKAAGGSSPFGSDSGSGSDSDPGSGSGSSGGIFGDGGGFPGTSGGGPSDYGDSGIDVMGAASLSVVPLTVTLLWVGALYLGARMLRTRGAGLEAAARLSLLVTGVVLVLGLFAQPEVAGVAVSSSPLLAALGALAISLAVTCGVLQRDDLAAWLSQRPAARSTVRALGTAVRVLGAVLALCSLVGFVAYASAYANAEDVDGTALLVALPILPNIGFTVLGLSWGVPVEYDVQGQYGTIGSSTEHGSFGLPEINDVWGGGAVAGALALGVVCALTLGVWAARRSADRREQLLAGGFSLGLVLLLTGVSGVSAELAGGFADWGGQGTSEFEPSVPDALLFGLLWVGAATFLGPYALRMVGQQAAVPPVATVAPVAPTGPVAPVAPVAPLSAYGPVAAPVAPPVTPAAPAAPYVAGPTPCTSPPRRGAHDPAATAAVAERKRKVLVWTATLTAAFVIGGGATAGALLLKKNNDESDQAQNKPPAASQSPTPKQDPPASASPSASPSASSSASSSASASVAPSATPSTGPSQSRSPGGAALPAGFVLKQDPVGFTVGVMDGWKRRQAGSQIYYEAPTGGSYIQIGIVRNTPMSSYENFLGLEKKHLETPETGYQRSQLVQNTYQGRPGALWEFTHIPEPDEGGLRRHVIDQAFVAVDGTEYAILAAGRADLWDANRDVVFSTVINTFRVN